VSTTAQDAARLVTIVIPVCDDPLIYRCLASIDVDCPVVVATNGSPGRFLDALRAHAKSADRVSVVSSPHRGIGSAYNQAIAHATTPLVLLMDSDCVFEPGAISAMLAAHEHDLVKGRVEFETSTRGTRLVAAARRLTEDPLLTGKVSAYSPPLLYRTSIVGEMGGYHFASALKWREDRDFELRRRTSGLAVHLVPKAVIRHKPLSVRADLRSVWAYGTGQAHGERLSVLPKMSAAHELKKVRATIARAIRNGSAAAGAYAAVRGIVLLTSRAIEMGCRRG
jgi:glycosyltransferase involved in cell wall biosynthesis